MNRTFYFLLLGHSFATVLAQTGMDIRSGDIRWGLYASGNLNHHEAQFRALPTVPNCCVEFLGNDAFRYSIGALLDWRMTERTTLEFRFGYSDMSSRLHEENFIGNAILGNDVVQAYSEHSIDATLGLLELQPLLQYRPFAELPLFLQGGFSFGTLVSKSYDQRETLTRPAGATYNNDSTTRNVFRGEIPLLQDIQSSFVAGISSRLASVWMVDITPEIVISLPLHALIDGIDWRVLIVKIGASVRLNFIAETETAQPAAVHPAYTPFLNVRLEAEAIKPDGSREKNVHFRIDETLYIDMYPLLPYVFFGENSSELDDSRLHLLDSDKSHAFDEHSLQSSTMEVYTEMLNIIGKRMRLYPTAEMSITGCNNNLAAEMNNVTLSMRRAEAVKKYLLDVWKIDGSRIHLRAQNLPTIPTRNDAIDGQVENRRAEITSDDRRILAPVRLEEMKSNTSITSLIFHPIIETSSRVTDWNLSVQQHDSVLFTLSGRTAPSDIVWQMQNVLPHFSTDSMKCILTVQNDDRILQSVEQVLPVTFHRLQTQLYEMRNDMRVERYRLILFDFDLANLGMMNRDVLDSVALRIEPSSKVIIQGYADRTGTFEYNKTLASMRCESVYRYLKNFIRADQLQVEAIGSDTLLFNNDFPEGRNYNRTVFVTIETPVQNTK